LSAPVQLHLHGELPLDPERLAELTAPDRRRAYDEAGLAFLQRAAAEDAVRLIINRRYRGATR
jgi:hypothetical protein